MTSNNERAQPAAIPKKKTRQVPDTYVIIFFVALGAAILTYLVPPGQFDTEEITYDQAGVEKTRTVLVQGSFRYAVDEAGSPAAEGIVLFAPGGGMGFLNFVFEGLVSGSKWGSAVGVIAFILIVGGAFGIMLRTGAIEDGLLALMAKTQGREALFIPAMFTVFALGGAVYGLGEECIAFAMITVPLAIALGYNALVGVMMTYMASQIGFATSWMNPFSVAVAQGIAGVPVLSGAGFRIVVWATFVAVGIAYTMRYAAKVKRDPTSSLSYDADEYFRKDLKAQEIKVDFTLGHWLVILTLVLGIIWVIWGVVTQGYYIPEIATIFFIIGLVSGVIGIVFKLNAMTVNDAANAFKNGVRDLAPAAIIVGMAKGIVLILGGDDPSAATVMNTILNSAGAILGGLHEMTSAWIMLVFQSVFNFFVSSGSGQAALTMPLMAPLADLAGVTRQVAVLAFQLGDGLTNMLIPTSSALIGTLGVARIDYVTWIRHIYKLGIINFLLASAFILIGVAIGFN
jgi:uncharacterized ion transporter superfamily protein YfcC